VRDDGLAGSQKYPEVTSQERMIRAVLDANVFISGILHAQGAPGQVLDSQPVDQCNLDTAAVIEQ
jgi:hypothetical protein